MFLQELKRWRRQLAGLTGLTTQRVPALQAAVEWAEDRLSRINFRLKEMTEKFRDRKASWGLSVKIDELPNRLERQIAWAKVYLIGGIAILLAEAVVLTFLLEPQVESRGYTAPWSWVLAGCVALIITAITAAACHLIIHILYIRGREPDEAVPLIWRYCLIPVAIVGLICLIGLGALWRLPAADVIRFRPLFVALFLIAMTAWILLGAGALVLSHLLFWSKERFIAFEELLTERQLISTFLRECVGELYNLLPPPRPPSPEHGGSQVGALMLIALSGTVLLAGLCSNCDSTPAFTYEAQPQAVELLIESDSSGSLVRDQLEVASRNIQSELPKIVEAERVAAVRVSWFGSDGWSQVEKAFVEIPPLIRPQIERPEGDEVTAIRPDVGVEEAENNQEVLNNEHGKLMQAYRQQISSKLAPLADVLIPPPGTRSVCTDLQGAVRRHDSLSKTQKAVVISVTDGRQTCERLDAVTRDGERVRLPIVVILVPSNGTNSSKEFETRKQMYESAYSCIEVLPHFDRRIHEAVRRAVEKCN